MKITKIKKESYLLQINQYKWQITNYEVQIANYKVCLLSTSFLKPSTFPALHQDAKLARQAEKPNKGLLSFQHWEPERGVWADK